MEYKVKQQKWSVDTIPDQNGRVVIVTGSSSGIGYETSKVLFDKNATIIMAVRNERKGINAIQKIMNGHLEAHIELMLIDLTDLQSIRKFSEVFRQKFNRLDLLINNAGVMIPPYSKTKDGFELQFGTNHLGHFALTGLLIDLILKTKNSRIVNVSSNAHKYGNLYFDDLNWEKRKYRKWQAYGDSKIANLYFTYELQRKLKKQDTDTIITAAHPGVTITELQRHSRIINFLTGLIAMKSNQGALPTLRAAIDESAKSGDYFGPDGWQQLRGYPIKVESNKRSHDKEIAKKLWDVSEELTGVKYQL